MALRPGAGLDTGVITLSLDQAAASEVTVSYTVGGTATSGTDYAALSGTAVFAVGADTVALTVTPIDDGLIESDETVEVTLTAGTDYQLGATTSGVVTISSDDVAMPTDPVVSLTVSDGAAAEGGLDTGVITLSLDQAAASEVTVSYTVGGTATSGTDYTALSGTAVFAVGADTVALTVTPIDDGLIESDETVEVTLTAGTDYQLGATTSGVVTIPLMTWPCQRTRWCR